MSMTDETRRPTAVVERDRAVTASLALGPRTLASVAEELSLQSNQVYGAFWRLRRAGFVEKQRVGGRTPVWQLTAEGQVHLQELQAAPVEAPAEVAPVEVAEPPAIPVG